MQASRSPGLSFFLNEETGDLHARFDPAGDVPAFDLAAARQSMHDGGWDALYIDEKALADFAIRCRSVLEVSEQIVGARRDGEFAVIFSDDMMVAQLTLIAPQGGKPVGASQKIGRAHV